MIGEEVLVVFPWFGSYCRGKVTEITDRGLICVETTIFEYNEKKRKSEYVTKITGPFKPQFISPIKFRERVEHE